VASSEWQKCPVVIPYFGGKFELSRKLVPMLPPHDRYIEVFAGGLSVFFRKKKSDWNVVNDLDNDIVNLYITIIEKFDELKNYIYWLPRSRELFNQFKKEIKGNQDIEIPDFKRAGKYYYNIKCAFNKNVHGSFAKSKKEDWSTKLIKELKYSRTFFNRVTIENFDFRTLIEKYPPRDIDLWYLDPPYVIAGERGDYYKHSFKWEDHEDLKLFCDEINEGNGKFMVSYDNREEIKKLYSDYNVTEIGTRYAGATEAREKIFTELVITNYDPVSIQETLFGG
jgi:DNA adenine methylase|tara:strand:- start:2565 stop:3407 length:843 start_codon:yes stop_codon:yes gene_type:complete